MDESVIDWKRVRSLFDGDASGGRQRRELSALLAGAEGALLSRLQHGDLPRFRAAVDDLSRIQRVQAQPGAAEVVVLSDDVVQLGASLGALEVEALGALQRLSPWRKGPFSLGGVLIDAEWRSNLKWDRVKGAVAFSGAAVLDVGCGNGYYGYRALGAGARCVLGVDPTVLYGMQFQATRVFARELPTWVLPLRLEDLPSSLSCFDITLSMGVLYHRPSPIVHLRDLRQTLRPGGTLVLETLVIEGDERTVLLPEDRYAGMRNVYFLPSCAALLSWLRRAGFSAGRVVDISPTTVAEQRATAFCERKSLADFLDPVDPTRTCEGEPAPVRAVVIAQRD